MAPRNKKLNKKIEEEKKNIIHSRTEEGSDLSWDLYTSFEKRMEYSADSPDKEQLVRECLVRFSDRDWEDLKFDIQGGKFGSDEYRRFLIGIAMRSDNERIVLKMSEAIDTP